MGKKFKVTSFASGQVLKTPQRAPFQDFRKMLPGPLPSLALRIPQAPLITLHLSLLMRFRYRFGVPPINPGSPRGADITRYESGSTVFVSLVTCRYFFTVRRSSLMRLATSSNVP